MTSFSKRAPCDNRSKALRKSKAKQRTYGTLSNSLDTKLVMAISAAVVEPVGLKANCELNVGCSRIGVICSFTIYFSMRRERIGVSESGRRSDGDITGFVFGTGRIDAVFHCGGTYDDAREILNR